MTLTPFTFAMALAMLAQLPARAETMVRYDAFDGPSIDASRWVESSDSVRAIRKGGLTLSRRTLGSTTSNRGAVHEDFSLSFANASEVSAIGVTVTPQEFSASACVDNTTIGSSRLIVGGAFFNTSTPTLGSSVGDVVAQIALGRASNSTDAADELRITGTVYRCVNANCNGVKVIGSPVDLGKTTVGSKTRLLLSLDRATKTFSFQRDADAPGTVTYTDSDVAAASRPAKVIGIRNTAPNCAAGSRPEEKLTVRIDNVLVNQSAMP